MNTRKALDFCIYLLIAAAGPAALAQQGSIKPEATVTSGCGHNTLGIVDWTLTYFSTGFSAISLAVQSAPDAGGVPGVFVTFPGTTTGTNPATSTTGVNAQVFMTGYAPWMRVRLNSATGTGVVAGVLYGCLQPGCAGGGSSGGGGGGGGCTTMAPCPVEGVNASGTAPTVPPVYTAGFDGTNVQPIRTDTTGHPVTNPLGAATAQADGATNTPNVPEANGAAATVPVYPFKFNGLTWDREIACTNQQAFNLSAATDVVIASGSAAKKVRLCHVSFANDSPQAFVFRSGTASTCATGTAALTGTYGASINGAFDFSSTSPLIGASGADACLHFGAAVTGGGVAIFALY